MENRPASDWVGRTQLVMHSVSAEQSGLFGQTFQVGNAYCIVGRECLDTKASRSRQGDALTSPIHFALQYLLETSPTDQVDVFH